MSDQIAKQDSGTSDGRSEPRAILAVVSVISIVIFVYSLLFRPLLAPALFGYIGLVSLAAFYLVQIRYVTLKSLVLLATMVSISICALRDVGALNQVLLDSVYRTQILIILYVGMTFLKSPAARSPTLRATGEAIKRKKGSAKIALLATTSHFVSATLNIAGASLFLQVLDKVTPKERIRLERALITGFVAASCWSPYYLAMTVTTIIVPDLSWTSVLPFGIGLAALFIFFAWAANGRLGNDEPESHSSEGQWSANDRLNLGLIIVLLTGSVLLLVEIGHVPPSVAIGAVGPAFGLAWYLMIQGSGLLSSAVSYMRQNLKALPSLREEIILFFSANFLALSLVQASQAFGMEPLVQGISSTVIIIALPFVIVLAAAIGLHPLVPIIIGGELMVSYFPELSPLVVAIILLSMWGIATAACPLSAVNLYVSRQLGTGPFALAWRWHLPYALVGTALVVLYSLALDRYF